jgi:hypothetical protein
MNATYWSLHDSFDFDFEPKPILIRLGSIDLKKKKICTIKIGIFGNVIILGSLRVVFALMSITCHGGFRKFMVYLSIEAVKKLDCNTIWTQFFLLVFAFKLCFLDV